MLFGLGKLILKPIKTNRMKNNELEKQHTGSKYTKGEKIWEENFSLPLKSSPIKY